MDLSSFFQKEDIQKFSKETIKVIGSVIYNEIYPYVWFICIYMVFLLFLSIANFLIIFTSLQWKPAIFLRAPLS
jgi:hypothetical protein